MQDSPLIFVDIDTQRDFLDPEGSLFIPGSGAILANLERLTKFARQNGIPVIATACAHTLDEIDPEPFPPHCLVGTAGQLRLEATQWLGGEVLTIDDRLSETEPLPGHLTLEKCRYEIFSRADAGEVFARYATEFGPDATFVVYGVATDYCVRAAVLGLRANGHNVVVVADAVWAIDQSAEPEQFADFVSSGAMLTITETIIG